MALIIPEKKNQGIAELPKSLFRMLSSEVAFLAMLCSVAFFVLLSGTAALLTNFRNGGNGGGN